MTQTQGYRKAGPPRRAGHTPDPLLRPPPPGWLCVGGAEGTTREEACGWEGQGQGTGPRGASLPFRAPESREPRAALNNGLRRGCPAQCLVPHPAILLPGRTLPPFLATPDPISAVYSELGAGLATGLEQSFPAGSLPLSGLCGPWGRTDPWCGPV